MTEILTIERLAALNEEDAMDAFQEFAMNIIERGFPSFDPRKGNAEAYILTAWRNHLRKHAGRNRQRAGNECQMPLDGEGKPLLDAEARDSEPPVPILEDLKPLLKPLLEFLSHYQQAVVLQRYLHGGGQLKPFRDIAAEMEKTDDAVRQAHQRAMTTLRRHAATRMEGSD